MDDIGRLERLVARRGPYEVTQHLMHVLAEELERHGRQALEELRAALREEGLLQRLLWELPDAPRLARQFGYALDLARVQGGDSVQSLTGACRSVIAASRVHAEQAVREAGRWLVPGAVLYLHGFDVRCELMLRQIAPGVEPAHVYLAGAPVGVPARFGTVSVEVVPDSASAVESAVRDSDLVLFLARSVGYATVLAVAGSALAYFSAQGYGKRVALLADHADAFAVPVREPLLPADPAKTICLSRFGPLPLADLGDGTSCRIAAELWPSALQRPDWP